MGHLFECRQGEVLLPSSRVSCLLIPSPQSETWHILPSYGEVESRDACFRWLVKRKGTVRRTRTGHLCRAYRVFDRERVARSAGLQGV